MIKKTITLMLAIGIVMSLFTLNIMASEPVEVNFSGNDSNVGLWLNTVQDSSKPGFYWIKFNANASFNAIKFYLFASTNNPAGRWKLFSYNTDLETTLAGTPVATQALTPAGDAMQTASFDAKAPGQYVFYIECDETAADRYFTLAITSTDPDPKYFESGFNGTNTYGGGHQTFNASVVFTETAESYFNELIADGASNPETGDVALIGYGLAALAAALLKKRKVR